MSEIPQNLSSCQAPLNLVSASPAVVEEVDYSAGKRGGGSTTGGLHVVIDSACELLNAMVALCSNLSKTRDET